MKQTKYWLWGSTITIIIFFIAVIVVYWFGQIKIINYTVQCLIAPCWDEAHIYLFGSNDFLLIPQVLSRVIILAVLLFIVGGISGWIYGKVKNKKFR